MKKVTLIILLAATLCGCSAEGKKYELTYADRAFAVGAKNYADQKCQELGIPQSSPEFVACSKSIVMEKGKEYFAQKFRQNTSVEEKPFVWPGFSGYSPQITCKTRPDFIGTRTTCY